MAGMAILTIPFFLYLIALALVLVSGITNRVPIWIPVLLICIGLLVGSAVR
jgi:hypothetical protein